jgi:hypothetical protein
MEYKGVERSAMPRHLNFILMLGEGMGLFGPLYSPVNQQ